MQQGNRTIFVTGATGRQGHSTCRYLREAGWTVRGLTRDPESERGRELQAMGVELIKGDLDDPSSIRSGIEGAYGVVAILTYTEEGAAAEVRQGRNLADAAKDAGVQHFVYSSVCGADRKTDIPFFDSKRQNEIYIMSKELPWTFLRPAHFMENFNMGPQCRSIRNGELVFPLPPDKPLQMVAIADIGFFAAMAFDRKDEMLKKSIDLAGDQLTMPEIAQRFSAHLGREVRFVQMPLDELEKRSREYFLLARWLQREGYKANIAAARRLHPSMLNFDTWLSSGFWLGTSGRKKVMEGVRA